MPSHSPLAAVARPGRFGRPDTRGVSIREIVGRGLCTIIARKGRSEMLATAVRAAFGCDLPTTPRRVTGRGVAFVWAGPSRWLAVLDAAPPSAEALLATCRDHAALVEQSDASALVRISGPQTRATLAKGLPIDLDERAFRPDDAAVSVAAHIPIHLWQVDDTPTYEICVPRSLAGSFWHWLGLSAAEFGYEVTPAGE
jgi:sarcosine oxidase subunit gamma